MMSMEKQEFRCKMCGQAFPSNEELDMDNRQAHPKAVSGQQKEWRSDPGQSRHAPGRDRPGQDSPMKVGMKEGTSEGQTTNMPRPGNTQTWDPRRADSMGNNPRNTPNRERKTDAHGGMETDSGEGSPENKPEEE